METAHSTEASTATSAKAEETLRIRTSLKAGFTMGDGQTSNTLSVNADRGKVPVYYLEASIADGV